MNAILRAGIATLPEDRKGSTLVVSLLGMVLLLGAGALAVDVGLMALEANTTQRACDASALAAAMLLQIQKTGSTYTNSTASQQNAVDEAVFIGAQNGIIIQPASVTFPQAGRVQVIAAVNSSLFLSKIWGSGTARVTRMATAEKSTLKGINLAAPLGISITDYQAWSSGSGKFTVKLARNTSDPFGPGNVLALSLDKIASKPVAIFEKELREGFPGQVLIGQWVNSLNAADAQQNALLDAMKDRLALGYNILPIFILPDKGATVGTSWHEIKTLAMIKVHTVQTVTPEGAKGHSEDVTELSIQFMPDYVVNSDKYNVAIGMPGNSSVRVLRLVDDL